MAERPPTPRPLGPGPLVTVAVYLAFSAVLALVQPPGALPDEPAHLQYIRFLATERRLPAWDPIAPEAGYESQHPPLAYLLYVPAAMLGGDLGDAGFCYLMRATAVLAGLAWLAVAWRLFVGVFGPSPRARWSLAALAWLPLFLLYAGHPNPDLVVGLLATLAVDLGRRLAADGPDVKRAAALGATLGAALLTKLSGIAIVAPLVAALLMARRRGQPPRALARDAVVAALVALLLATPWFAGNLRETGRAIRKAPVHYGSAIENAAAGRLRVGELLRMTAGRTYLSSWCQPDWLPGWRAPDGPERPVYPIVLFYAQLSGLLVAGLLGLRRLDEPATRDLLALGGVLLAAVLAGQQLAFWTQDIEFNMGGRYVLAAMPVLLAAVTSGLARGSERLPAVWLGLMLVMNVVAVATIVSILNPHYQPGWRPPWG